MIGVGLIGYGLAGRSFHAPVIRAVPGLQLVTVLQRHGDEARLDDPGVRIVRNLDEMLAIPEIRVVVIATPNESHFPLAAACLRAGRDVVVDKPFTTTLAEARELVALAAQLRRLITVYQIRRWDGGFRTVQQLIDSGKLGRLVRYICHYDRFRPRLKPGAWRERPSPGSGILFDLGPHLIDQALALFGSPEFVHADVRTERDGAQTDDAFEITFFYPGGLRAVLHASMLAAAPRPHFILQGTGGSFVKSTMDPQEPALRTGWRPAPDESGLGEWISEDQRAWGVLTTASEDGTIVQTPVPTVPGDFREFYANVRDAVEGKAALAVRPSQALDVMRAIELARESSQRRAAVRWDS
jgi:predicted dehydrogenase